MAGESRLPSFQPELFGLNQSSSNSQVVPKVQRSARGGPFPSPLQQSEDSIYFMSRVFLIKTVTSSSTYSSSVDKAYCPFSNHEATDSGMACCPDVALYCTVDMWIIWG